MVLFFMEMAIGLTSDTKTKGNGQPGRNFVVNVREEKRTVHLVRKRETNRGSIVRKRIQKVIKLE